MTGETPRADGLPARSRGVIALLEENCTVCMLCARECPDWCIYIESHQEPVPGTEYGGGDPARASLYASVDAQNRTVLVAINKTEAPLKVKVDLAGVAKAKAAAVYRLTSADAKPVAADDVAVPDPASLALELPPLSVSTMVLKP